MAKYDISVKLIGQYGNAFYISGKFYILGKVVKALKEADAHWQDIEEYQKKATSGDYDNLLRVTMEYVNVE